MENGLNNVINDQVQLKNACKLLLFQSRFAPLILNCLMNNNCKNIASLEGKNGYKYEIKNDEVNFEIQLEQLSDSQKNNNIIQSRLRKEDTSKPEVRQKLEDYGKYNQSFGAGETFELICDGITIHFNIAFLNILLGYLDAGFARINPFQLYNFMIYTDEIELVLSILSNTKENLRYRFDNE